MPTIAGTAAWRCRAVWLVVLALQLAHGASSDEPAERVLAPPGRGASGGEDHFLGRADAPIRAALGREDVVEVRRGRGGRSIAFQTTLADGTRGYFKPEQRFSSANWRGELGAYHLDRELGLGRVAPTVARSIAWRRLRSAAAGDWRAREVRVGSNGFVRGALVWWIDERLVPLRLPSGWVRWLRIDGEPDRVTPFQRPSEYPRARGGDRATRRAIALVEDGRCEERAERGASAPDPDVPERPAELSDLIVFDYLAHNADRWGSANTNVRTVGAGGPLMSLDNGASFTLRRARLALLDSRLYQVQRFRRSTIEAVRRFDLERFAARLEAEPLEASLDERQLANLETRRAHLLAYVDALLECHGEAAVYAW